MSSSPRSGCPSPVAPETRKPSTKRCGASCRDARRTESSGQCFDQVRRPPRGSIRRCKEEGERRAVAGIDPHRLLALPSLGRTVWRETLRSLEGDLHCADSREADPHACVVFDDGHEGVVAMRAAHHDAGASKDMSRTDRLGRPARATCRRLRSSSRLRIAPGVVLRQRFHRASARPSQPPVAPKRSVLIALGSCPRPTSASATTSTNDVGPHT